MAMTMEEVQALVQQMQAKKKAVPKNPPLTREEGLYVQYKLRVARVSCAEIAGRLDCNSDVVRRVINGKRRSQRIEKEVARTLGYDSWAAMVRAIRATTVA